jgi:hypothetical protein
MRWTPRQLAAHLHFIDRELAIEQATFIQDVRLAFHGKDKDVSKYIKALLPEI